MPHMHNRNRNEETDRVTVFVEGCQLVLELMITLIKLNDIIINMKSGKMVLNTKKRKLN